MLPFTIDQFLGVFEQYNQAIWPMHIVAYILGIAAIFLAAKKTRYSNQAISVILACFWAWIGIVYHLMYFSTINGAAIGFGILFIVQAILWLVFGVIRPKLAFQLDTNPYALTGVVLIVYAMLVYPLIGTRSHTPKDDHRRKPACESSIKRLNRGLIGGPAPRAASPARTAETHSLS